MLKLNKFTYILTTIISAVVFIFSLFVGGSVTVVHAATSTKTVYEETNVWDNLQSSTIAGNVFNVEDYPYRENGKPQIISFIEFGYSYYASKQTDYGLYVYIFNPQQLAFDTDTERNKVQLKCGGFSWKTLTLRFLNYSEEAGYEGRFYKFEIILSDEDRSTILKGLNAYERVYEISGITLSYKQALMEYPVVQQYTYTGFAIGYGSELAENDTLSCKVDGFDKYLTLDVHDTFFRGNGTNGKKYIKDTLHSVYFSVPNEIIEDYGRMTAVHATWLNAYTAPALVTGNSGYYETMLDHISEEIGVPESSSDMSFKYLFRTAEELVDTWIGSYHVTSYYCGYNYPSGLSANIARNITNLHWLFNAKNGDADTYDVPSEDILDYMKRYTAVHGGELVNDKYSKALFESVDETFTDINIKADETYSLTSEVIKQSWWEKLFGTSHVEESKVFNDIKAIEAVDYKDIANLESVQVCSKYYVDDADYEEFSNFCKASEQKGETVYLFRYKQSEYFSAELYEGELKYHPSYLIGHTGSYSIENDDTNAFVMQQWVQLDFDIIDLTFTKDNVETVIPVVMSPMDIVADGDHPVVTTPDGSGCDRVSWKIILGLIAGLFIFILLFPVLRIVFVWIFKALLWLITLPFRIIGAVFKGIKNHRQKRKVKKEQKKKTKQPEPPVLSGNVKPEEVDAYLNSIDWDSAYWTELDGKGG